MKATVLGILTITSIYSFASNKYYYVQCDKTYIDPEAIDLHERKIKFKSLGKTCQTSAIYADENGLYYQDYLEDDEQPLPIDDHCTTPNRKTDEQLDPFADVEIFETSTSSSTPPSHSNQPIQDTPPPVQQQPSAVKKTAWPYCNKQR